MALGKPMVYSPTPNYPLTTSPNDPMKLTDGQVTTATMWIDKTTAVGWSGASPISITLDLGSETPIDSMDMSTGARTTAGVYLPRAIVAYGSDDGNQWARLGPLELPAPVAQPTTYQRFVYTLSSVGKTCRYIRFMVVPTGGNFFSDEVHVYASNGGSQKIAPSVADTKEDVRDALVAKAKEDREAKDAVEARDVASRLGVNQPASTAEIPATWVRIARAKGTSGLRLWRQNRFAPLTIHTFPTTEHLPTLAVNTFKNEERGDAFLLSSALDTPANVRVTVSGTAAIPDYIKVAAVPWTDVFSGELVSDALPYIKPAQNEWSFSVRPGMTTRIWVQVNPKSLPTGQTHVELSLAYDGGPIGAVPLNIDVSPAKVPEPELSLAGWDYVDGFAFGGVTPATAAAYNELIKDSPVDTVCALSRVLPDPKSLQFSGSTVTGLNFANADRWIALHPGVRNRLIAIGSTNTFAGEKMGTPDFALRVGAYVKAVADHFAAADPKSRLLLLLVDEPKSEQQAEVINAWAEAIKATTNKVQLFEDPLFKDLSSESVRRVFSNVDIICFEEFVILPNADLTNQYKQLASGKELWCYATQPSPKEFDPTDYYRLVPWLAYANDLQGIQYWSFTDIGSARSSWSETSGFKVGYSPLFLGSPMATSIHWEALRDGMWDNELFRELARASKGTPQAREANQILSDVRRLGSEHFGPNPWQNTGDAQEAEALRAKATSLLERIQH